MGPSLESPGRTTFTARFEGGPRQGTMAFVRSLASGQPPDLIRIPGQPEGLYLLAGGPRRDGSLPYWWMTRDHMASLRARGLKSRSARIANVS
jgi:hypothetical protein